ncbi:type VI secretion system lipoprotein TssJ [Xenorhabdus bharatensis]|uniref:type VI secretion system lipoprotein TssJ n=1 Tax=Xenorhabdus bharatensis TaxID=3136256 RepID=UPI0030F4897E
MATIDSKHGSTECVARSNKSNNPKKGAMAFILFAALCVTGCGLTQTIGDGSAEVTRSIFYKKIKEVHLDFQVREGSNLNDNGIALSTMVRLYQLKDRRAFDLIEYQNIFTDDMNTIQSDVLSEKDLQLRPGESYSLDMPLEKGAQYVAVVAMFHSPDLTKNNWQIVIPKTALEPDKARQVELKNQAIYLLPQKKD